jgi:hypothetical protein
LVLLTYTPAAVLGLSSNPRYFDSGLTTQALGGVLPGLPIIDPNAGTTTQSLGHLSAEDWLHGTVPWWNPYAGVGLPLAAEMQSDSFFMPFVLLLHFDDGVIYLRIVMQILAGLASIALLRQLRMTYTASFLGGLLYALNGTFAWFAHALIMPLPFLPLLLLGIERARDSAKAKQRGGWVWITIAIAYSIYSGFPEVAFMNGLLALVWAVLRLCQQGRKDGWAFAVKVTAGGVGGILLAAPLLLPFFEYVQHSAVSHNDFSHAGLPDSSLLQLLLPYIFGPIFRFGGADGTTELSTNWGDIGGYFGIAVVFLAILGCLRGQRERALRILLLLWTVLLVARMVNVPGTDELLRFIPGMSYVAVYRNSSGSFEMAAIVLAAFAVDAWRRNPVASKLPVLAALAITSLLGWRSYVLAAPLVGRLLAVPDYLPYPRVSVFAASFFLAATVALCAGPPNRRRAALLSAVVACESMTLCTIPSLSGLRKVTEDLTPLTFLRQHLGTQRAYTLGMIHPNYGSYFDVPFINHESLPVSDAWISFARHALDPNIDSVTFSGDYPPPFTARLDAMRNHLGGIEKTGVRYIVVPRDSKSFATHLSIPHQPGNNYALSLAGGQQLSGSLSKIGAGLASADAVAILVGTNGGKSSGSLSIELCSGTKCSSGTAQLEGAKDNAPRSFDLDPPLPLETGAQLRFTVKHSKGYPVALWVFPAVRSGATVTTADGHTVEATPDVTLYRDDSNQPKRVFQTANSDILELPDADDYFSAAKGGCSLTVESKTALQASCRAADTLIRRELFYPGWRAGINGNPTMMRSSEIFQAIDLPSGNSRVEFSYRPTHLTETLLAALAGLGILGGGIRRNGS